MRLTLKKYLPRFLPILFFAGTLFVLFSSSPEDLIRFVGIENAYALIFALAFLGGLTTFSGIPYHLVLITLASGGLNPYLLGMTTALAVSLGDCTSYYVGYYGRDLLPVKLQSSLQRLSKLQVQHPRLLPAAFFFYGACIPFSSDLITIPMGILRYPLWKVIVPLGIGTVIFNTVLALIAAYSYEWFVFL